MTTAFARSDATLATLVEAAVRGGFLRLDFQPVVRLTDGQLDGVEALVRCTHPALDGVSPGRLVATAERAGLVGRLTEHVLDAAFLAGQVLAADVRIGVNVSSRDVADPGFAARLMAAAARAGLDPARVLLEITETWPVEDVAIACGNLAVLRSHGVRSAIDDYGTGWAGPLRRDQLPVDCLKLDRSLIADVDGSAAARARLGVIVDDAHGRGMTTCAEGVERPEQLRALARLGVLSAQGWLLGRPRPLEDLLA